MRPAMIALCIVALLVMLGVLAGAPEFVKQNRFVFWAIFVLTLIKLVSWVSNPTEKAVETQIAAGRESAKGAAESSAGTATLSVYRRRAFMGALNPLYAYCDGALIATLKNGSYTVCTVAAGQHALSLGSPSSRAQTNVVLVSGQECFLRCNYLAGKLESVSREQAAMETGGLQRVG
jgi:Protein of unknown function (DUF2846)